MTIYRVLGVAVIGVFMATAYANQAYAALSLTAGSNATTTPNVATAITGFQIVGPEASTTPVKLRATNGTLNLSTVGGVTMTGNGSGTVSLSGAVASLNAALSTLTYSRSTTGTDTLEVSLVEAGEVFFEDNGHLYKYISDAGDWNAARTKAEAQSLYGATGYLATITSANENAFVTARLSNAGWMGGNDGAVEGAWRWVTGPENGTQFWTGLSGGSTVGGNYANWGTGEPNDSGGNEDCTQYLSGGTGKWNDLPCSGTSLPGYVAEFGAPGNMPQVVAQNISIVTADVPAITSLSPANGAASASPSANLVIGFSKSVTKQTGSILIKKASDDSTVETIDASGPLVSGSGSGTITINPDTTLAEGTSYYVLVPSTAFMDSSNNFFSGITASTTWAFTTSDVTAPQITDLVATSTATTTTSITWTTNEPASTKVVYAAGTTYSLATSESDTVNRVTSHTKTLSSLLACTTYNFKAVSADAAGNYATSTSGSFTTLGCVGSEPPSVATSTTVSATATSTTSLADPDTGNILSVETPPNVTATSSTIIIQIRALPADPVLAAIETPANVSPAASIVFDVTALVDSTTVLDSFDVPVTMTYTYADLDIAGLDESSLSMYHYHDAVWEELDDCSVDAGVNTITCTSPGFSLFAIFGSPLSSGSAHGRLGTSVRSQVANLEQQGNIARAEALKAQWPNLFASTHGSSSTHVIPTVRDLEMVMEGEDVRMLQTLLIAQDRGAQARALAGIGATGYFGTYTRDALAEYQDLAGIAPSVGYFGPLTRAQMKMAALGGLWW